MSESAGEKTEQPSARRLEEAYKKGQFAKSQELQTVFVLLSGLMALAFTGGEIWRHFIFAFASVLGHLHDLPLTLDNLPNYAVKAAVVVWQCAAPAALATVGGSLLAGGIQSRFRAASDALAPDWERVNPMAGLKRIVSVQSSVAAALSVLKLAAILSLTYSTLRSIASDPIFFTTVDLARISQFLTSSAYRLILRVGGALLALAALDYAYQCWKTHQELMMTREELKDEMKQSEGNQDVKSRQRRRRIALSKRKMLADVAHADVVITNPTHFAVALRYERHSMKAPKVVAKGARLNALKIRDLAREHQIPIVENKPLARLLYKYGKLGGEIPAQLYAAVAEVLAWVYRVNAYRYYREQQDRPALTQTSAAR